MYKLMGLRQLLSVVWSFANNTNLSNKNLVLHSSYENFATLLDCTCNNFPRYSTKIKQFTSCWSNLHHLVDCLMCVLRCPLGLYLCDVISSFVLVQVLYSSLKVRLENVCLCSSRLSFFPPTYC